MNRDGPGASPTVRRTAWVIGAAILLAAVVGFVALWLGRTWLFPGERVVAPAEPPFPTTHPEAGMWLSKWSYLKKGGGSVRVYDCDNDAQYDANEIARLGTLAYDGRSSSGAPLMRLYPKVPNTWDTDGDELPDEWEMGYFGTLKYGPWDDPDEDGYPNNMELGSKSPVEIDLADTRHRPEKFYPKIRSPRSWSIKDKEFWDKQEKAAEMVKAGKSGTRPAVEGYRYDPETTKAARARHAEAERAAAKLAPVRHASPNYARYIDMTQRFLTPQEDQDEDGLPDEWEREFLSSLEYDRQGDPDKDGFPNVVEWYLGTHPGRADKLQECIRPAELIDMPPPLNPWDPWWDFRSRRFWAAQDALPRGQEPAGQAGPTEGR